jgi:hypothetical protein
VSKTASTAGAQDTRICRPTQKSSQPRYVIHIARAKHYNIGRHVILPVYSAAPFLDVSAGGGFDFRKL